MTLREAMAAAARRDTMASEYVTDHAVTFELGLPALADALGDGLRPRDAVVELALRSAAVTDTLIARKRGADAAQSRGGGRAAGDHRPRRAQGRGRTALAEFDASLRQDGNALNPGPRPISSQPCCSWRSWRVCSRHNPRLRRASRSC